MPANPTISYKDWHISLSDNGRTLGDALDSLQMVNLAGITFPWRVRLLENPKYSVIGRNLFLFPGAMDAARHDVAHVLLGRGLLPKDEAFVIGFSMGSTGKFRSFDRRLFTLLARYLYPRAYRFDLEDIQVFNEASELGKKWNRNSLYDLDFALYNQATLADLREIAELDLPSICSYNRSEKLRYPSDPASQRLTTECE